MNTQIVILILIIIVAIILIGYITFLLNANLSKIINPAVNISGIEVFNIKNNDTVASPLKITGIVTGSGWGGFEGRVGTVKLVDSSGNELAHDILRATTEWTQLPTHFQANVQFTTSDTKGSLIFHNENASGDPIRDKTLTISIIFKK